MRGGALTPARAALSVAIGLFIGTLPLPGTHLPLVVAICLPLRLDAAVSYLAANISIPPIAPFLWIGSLQIGSVLLGGHAQRLDVEGARAMMARGPGDLLASLALGSVCLGALIALTGGSLTYAVARAVSSAHEAPRG